MRSTDRPRHPAACRDLLGGDDKFACLTAPGCPRWCNTFAAKTLSYRLRAAAGTGVGRTRDALSTGAEAGALLKLVRDVVVVPVLRIDERSEAVVDMRDVRMDPECEGMRGGGGGARRAEEDEDEEGRGGGLGDEGPEAGLEMGCLDDGR